MTRQGRLWSILCAIPILLLVLLLSATRPPVSLGRGFSLAGTVDCGRASGQACAFGSTVTILTTDLGGGRQQIVVDISWMLSQLPSLDQDDWIEFEVEADPDGTYRAVAITTDEGNPQPASRTRQGDDDDDDKPTVTDPTVTPTPAATSTAQPTQTATATRTLTATPSATPSVTTTLQPLSTGTLAPTSTVTQTPTVTVTLTPTVTATATVTVTSTLLPAGNVYTANSGGGSVSALALDTSGNPAYALPGSPFSVGTDTPLDVALNAAGTRLYVTGEESNHVRVFTLDPVTGTITGQQSGSPFTSDDTPIELTLNAAGTRLYVTNFYSRDVTVFTLGANGNITGVQSGSPFSSNGSGMYGLTVNPASGVRRLYVASQNNPAGGFGGIVTYPVDASGNITASGTLLTGFSLMSPLRVAAHPRGARLYVADQSNHIIVLTLDGNGDISGTQSGSPFAGVGASADVTVNAAGTRLYVTDASTLTGRVVVYPLNASTGDVTGPGVPFTAGTGQLISLTMNAAQTRLYATDQANDAVHVFVLDSNGNITGLAPGSSISTGADLPRGITVRD